MTTNIENNNKTEAIKASLEALLKKLEKRKQMIVDRKFYLYFGSRIPIYIPREKIKLLNIGISLLNNLNRQFDSVDDFNSVKKLRQTELFFKNPTLKDFAFLNYKSQIDPPLLEYVNIEIRLDKLSKKAKNLDQRGYHSESIIAKHVATELNKLNHWYFEEKSIDPWDYKKRALAVIEEAKPFLKQHRGCKRILTNLAALIFSLGTAFIVNKCINKRYLFFPETKSSELLTKLEHRVFKLNS